MFWKRCQYSARYCHLTLVSLGDSNYWQCDWQGYVRDIPQVKPLVLVLKFFLRQRKLHETYHGGVGSFLLTLVRHTVILNERHLAIVQSMRCMFSHQTEIL